MPWPIRRTSTFDRGYSNLSTDLKRRVDEAVSELALSRNPGELGVPKKGRFKGLYSYEVGRRVRIIYMVDRRAKVMYLLRVGPHEEAYR